MGFAGVTKGCGVAGMSLTELSLGGNNLINPAKGEFAKWHPAGERNVANLFLQCIVKLVHAIYRNTFSQPITANSKMCRDAELFFFGVVSKQKILQGIYEFSKLDEIKEGAGLEIIEGKG